LPAESVTGAETPALMRTIFRSTGWTATGAAIAGAAGAVAETAGAAAGLQQVEDFSVWQPAASNALVASTPKFSRTFFMICIWFNLITEPTDFIAPGMFQKCHKQPLSAMR
jgi:hypothetical protein